MAKKAQTAEPQATPAGYVPALKKMYKEEIVDACEQYGIMSIPTMLFFKNGELVNRHVGAARKQDIVQQIEAIL